VRTNYIATNVGMNPSRFGPSQKDRSVWRLECEIPTEILQQKSRAEDVTVLVKMSSAIWGDERLAVGYSQAAGGFPLSYNRDV
jgi:hypothetical protein